MCVCVLPKERLTWNRWCKKNIDSRRGQESVRDLELPQPNRKGRFQRVQQDET